MSIVVECAQGHKLRVNDDLAGRKIRCPKCQSVVTVKAASTSARRSADEPDDESFDDEPFGDEAFGDEAFGDEAWDSRPARQLPRRAPRSSGKGSQGGGSGPNVGLIAAGAGLAVVLVVTAVFFLRRPAAAPAGGDAPAGEPRAQAAVAAPAGENTSVSESTPAAAPESSPASEPASNAAATPAVAQAETTNVPAGSPAPAAPAKKGRNRPRNKRDEDETPASQSGDPSAAGAAGNRNGGTGAQGKNGAKEPEVPAGGVVVWDTGGGSAPQENAKGPAAHPSGWSQVPLDEAATHQFAGDCVVENEYVRLLLPRDGERTVELTAKSRRGTGHSFPLAFEGGAASARGARTVRVAALSEVEATVECGADGNGAQVACRMPGGKSWVEIRPVSRAERVVVGLRSQFVIVPSELGEDLICDSLLYRPGQSVPIPREQRVIALDCAANSTCLLGYTSVDQAGELTIGSGEGVSNHGAPLSAYVSSMSAKLNGQSVYLAALPQTDSWYSEQVGKKYSAAGQYDISWKPPHAGVWRMAGRVKGRLFVTDVPHDRFVFSCSQSGTLECLFAYLNDAEEGTEPEGGTPLGVFRETLQLAANEALPDPDPRYAAGGLPRRKTRYRDVCNSVDDMKDVWRGRPETLRSDPEYVAGLLADCQMIIERMDCRLHEYEALAEQLGDIAGEMKQHDSADARALAAAVQKCQSRLKTVKIPAAGRSAEYIASIERKLQTAGAGRLNVNELDKLAEELREIANHQEVQLKKVRGIVVELAEVCMKKRGAGSDEVRQYVLLAGRHCRRVLRNRDPEE